MPGTVRMGATIAGDAWSATESVPNCPKAFRPQHEAWPLGAEAHVCDVPAATSNAPVNEVGDGVRRSIVVPSPSWPCAFAPQHWTWPAVAIAQVCAPPAAMPVTPESPDTAVGKARAAVV